MIPVYPMLVPYDGEENVTVTEGFLRALIQVMKEECKMMVASGMPEDNWVWGRATISDLSDQTTLEYGGEEDRPEDQSEDFMVFIEKPVDDY